MTSRAVLTRALVRLVLVAALVSAPIFLLAEGGDVEHLGRVAASNGVCSLLCLGLLALLRRGRVELAAGLLVDGLLVIVGILAWINGEGVHVNVVNFVLVTVLAGILLGRGHLLAVGGVASAIMVGIAWKQAVPSGLESMTKARVESIVQFLPTYLVIVGVLWLRADAAAGGRLPGSREALDSA